MTLPPDLTKYFADSDVRLQAWDPNRLELVLHIKKEIGPEVGRIFFRGVSQICLPAAFTVAAMEVKRPDAVTVREWPDCSIRREDLGTADLLYLIEEAGGPRYFVIAQSLEYKKDR